MFAQWPQLDWFLDDKWVNPIGNLKWASFKDVLSAMPKSDIFVMVLVTLGAAILHNCSP